MVSSRPWFTQQLEQRLRGFHGQDGLAKTLDDYSLGRRCVMIKPSKANAINPGGPQPFPPPPDKTGDIEKQGGTIIIHQAMQVCTLLHQRSARSDGENRLRDNAHEALKLGNRRIGDVDEVAILHHKLLRDEVGCRIFQIKAVDHRVS